jgi:AhpD family alkylhydroperoxidase
VRDRLGKPLYSVGEAYTITYLAFRSLPRLLRARKKSGLDHVFMERIMIAVTEVNGCEICSYAHTRMALEAGMPEEEIREILLGVHDKVPRHQLSAILFGQHYADSRGQPSPGAYDRLVAVYGRDLATGILAAVRLMMWGNTYGIPYSSLVNRFKGKPDPRSSPGYEAGILLSALILTPIAGLQALLAGLARVSFEITA